MRLMTRASRSNERLNRRGGLIRYSGRFRHFPLGLLPGRNGPQVRLTECQRRKQHVHTTSMSALSLRGFYTDYLNSFLSRLGGPVVSLATLMPRRRRCYCSDEFSDASKIVHGIWPMSRSIDDCRSTKQKTVPFFNSARNRQ